MARCHGEFALYRHNLQAVGRANHIPKRGFARGGGDADARGTPVDVVCQVGRFGVARERAYAADLRLRHSRMVGEVVVLQQRIKRPPAAPKAERVYGQHALLVIHRVARIARLGVLARERLAHNHPQRIGNRRVVAARQHKPVRVRVLGAAVVVAQPAQLAARQVRCDRVRRVRQRPPEVARLRIVAQQN